MYYIHLRRYQNLVLDFGTGKEDLLNKNVYELNANYDVLEAFRTMDGLSFKPGELLIKESAYQLIKSVGGLVLNKTLKHSVAGKEITVPVARTLEFFKISLVRFQKTSQNYGFNFLDNYTIDDIENLSDEELAILANRIFEEYVLPMQENGWKLPDEEEIE